MCVFERVCVCVCMWVCLYVFVSMCLYVCECVRSVSTVWMKEVSVQLHSTLSFIDSQYVLLPG